MKSLLTQACGNYKLRRNINMGKTLAIIQARMNSTRLPGKVLLPLQDKPVIAWVVERAHAITGIDEVVVATSNNFDDDKIETYCKENNIECFRGDLDNVLKRFYDAARKYHGENIVRITADCPFLDPDVCAGILYMLLNEGYDYVSNALNPTFPDGLDCEAFTLETLERVYQLAKQPIYTEHVTSYINYHRSLFKVGHYNAPMKGLRNKRWTLDEPNDYRFMQAVSQYFKKDDMPRYIDILSILKEHPELENINNTIERNAGFEKNIKLYKQNERNPSFEKSKDFLNRAEKTIPLGSQTFSKSKTAYVPGYGPLFATHGLGGRIWDIDGNRYVDLVGGLMPNVLGYADPDVDYAIRQQLNNGITLSLATELETQLAEKLIEIIPCAEKVRFAKNGTDATSGCIRIARAYTKRERIIACGYHGWQDWYIGTTTKNKGIPRAVMELSHTVPYNDLDAVEVLLNQYKGEFAAMILEPMGYKEPEPGYLEALKTLLHKHGALLIFDEVITGFRFSLGGAQQLFGVTPDLASFGKSLGNGMPLSVVTGAAEIMNEMEEVFFSGTFGGETLSLVASLAVIEKMEREPVIETLWHTGKVLREETKKLITQYKLEEVVKILGNDVWTILSFADHQESSSHAIRTYLLHEMHKQGILTLGSHNTCYAHNAEDINYILSAYDYAFEKLSKDLMKARNLETLMSIPVIKPLFAVRKA